MFQQLTGSLLQLRNVLFFFIFFLSKEWFIAGPSKEKSGSSSKQTPNSHDILKHYFVYAVISGCWQHYPRLKSPSQGNREGFPPHPPAEPIEICGGSHHNFTKLLRQWKPAVTQLFFWEPVIRWLMLRVCSRNFDPSSKPKVLGVGVSGIRFTSVNLFL